MSKIKGLQGEEIPISCIHRVQLLTDSDLGDFWGVHWGKWFSFVENSSEYPAIWEISEFIDIGGVWINPIQMTIFESSEISTFHWRSANTWSYDIESKFQTHMIHDAGLSMIAKDKWVSLQNALFYWEESDAAFLLFPSQQAKFPINQISDLVDALPNFERLRGGQYANTEALAPIIDDSEVLDIERKIILDKWQAWK